MGTKRKSPKQDLTSANDLTIELPEGREVDATLGLPNLQQENTFGDVAVRY